MALSLAVQAEYRFAAQGRAVQSAVMVPRLAFLPTHMPCCRPPPAACCRAGFRDFPLGDLPMLEVLRQASEGVFVPLTVGGGIREFTDAQGRHYSALEVAAEYFRCACRVATTCGGARACVAASMACGGRWRVQNG